MRQRQLEIQLERVPSHPRPNPDLEQYRTPPIIAADILYRALAAGDIRGRTVVDLGCGTGMFLVGAKLLGAAAVTGVDIDADSLATARATLDEFELEADLVHGPVEALQGQFDTAIMNPPFGAQHAQRHADSLFLQHALRLAPVAYSLHKEDTLPHLLRLARSLDADCQRIHGYQFPIPHQFHFHSREKVLVPVALLRTQRMGNP